MAGFGAALTRLGAAQAVPPPPEMRARVLARLEYERQLPPPRRTEVVTAAAAPRAGHRRARWPRLALAASLAAATALGVVAVQQHEQAQQERATAERLRTQQAAFGELLTAPDARVTTTTAAGSGTGTGTGTVVWSASRNQAGFLAAGLPDPGPGRVYELWLDRAGTLSPAGLLADGNGALVLTAPSTAPAPSASPQNPQAGRTNPPPSRSWPCG
ncbi:anti-sigma factor [Kitasatospora aburaviensis]